MPPSPPSEELELAALEWIDATAVADGDGVWWSGKPSSDEPDPTLYHGTAGIIVALLEAHFGDPRWGELALRGTRWLAATMDTLDTATYPALYVGTAGTAFALHEAAERLGGETADTARAAAKRGLASVRAVYDGERWGDAYELMFGNAGIGLAALRMGDAELAEAAVAPYLRTAETTPFGQTWEQRRGQPARRHHISHGTLGIAYALAVVGTAVGRHDLVDAALAGAGRTSSTAPARRSSSPGRAGRWATPAWSESRCGTRGSRPGGIRPTRSSGPTTPRSSARTTIPNQRWASERHGRAGRPDLQDPVRSRLGGGPASGALRRVARRPARRVHSLLRW